jgi:peptide/nickel transport system permease protein
MRLWLYVVRRTVLAVPVLIGVMTILFVLQSTLPVPTRLQAQFGSASPKDPWIYQPTRPCPPPNAEQSCPNPTYAIYTARLGLNEPVPVQWATYLGQLFLLQWGYVGNGTTAASSIPDIQGGSVVSVLADVGPYSLELGILAGAMLMGLGIPLGRRAAAARNQASDLSIRGMTLALRAIPPYLMGSLLIMIGYLWLGSLTHWNAASPWCPTGQVTYLEFSGSWPAASCFPGGLYPTWVAHGLGTHPTGFPTVDALLAGYPWLAFDTVLRMLLPALVIALASMALLIRFVRANMLEVLNLDYVRAARANGLPESTVLRHTAGRNAQTLTLTILGLTFATFLGWFPVVELVFGLNGIGSTLAYSAITPYDFGLLFGITFLLSVLVVAASLIVDLLYAYYDPRVRLG